MRSRYFKNCLIRKLGQAGETLQAAIMRGAPLSMELVPIVLNVPVD
jgi:hypothetical protein